MFELYRGRVESVVNVNIKKNWLASLDDRSHELVIAALELLAERGPLLGRPLVDTVNGSRYSNMKELRPGSAGRTELRVLFAFDPQRVAILLVAGDKQGLWQRWYDDNVPVADDRFDAHLQTLTKGTKQKGRKKP
jgi:hypothetical protein